MNKIEELNNVSFNRVRSVTKLTYDEFLSYNDDLFSIYWFLCVNKLTNLKLTETDMDKIVSNGFLKSAALMHSISCLTLSDTSKMLYDGIPFDVSVQRISEMPNCKSASLTTFKGIDSNWFSIQYGVYSVNLPNYLWWVATDVVSAIVGSENFFICTDLASTVPVLRISFGKYDFMPVRQVLEFELGNSKDPLMECASKFVELNNYSTAFSYADMVTVIYQLVRLYDLDCTWRFAFVSPIMKRLVYAYEPGDTFLDSLWKCLHEDIDWVVKPEEHLYKSTVNLFGMKVDLVKYALDPKTFVERLMGGY